MHSVLKSWIATTTTAKREQWPLIVNSTYREYKISFSFHLVHCSFVCLFAEFSSWNDLYIQLIIIPRFFVLLLLLLLLLLVRFCIAFATCIFPVMDRLFRLQSLAMTFNVVRRAFTTKKKPYQIPTQFTVYEINLLKLPSLLLLASASLSFFFVSFFFFFSRTYVEIINSKITHIYFVGIHKQYSSNKNIWNRKKSWKMFISSHTVVSDFYKFFQNWNCFLARCVATVITATEKNVHSVHGKAKRSKMS